VGLDPEPKAKKERRFMQLNAKTLKKFLKRSSTFVLMLRTARNIKKAYHLERRKLKEDSEALQLEQKTSAFISDYFRSHATRKLQIGTGANVLSGWLNTDYEPASETICYMNALERFRFEDSMFDYIFSEHMIEHMTYKGGLYMLMECYRVLKPGGRIRISTPNICNIIGLYAANKTNLQKRYLHWSSAILIGLYGPEATDHQKREPEWVLPTEHINRYFPDPEMNSACFVVNCFFRSWGHKFLYDPQTLTAALREAGFVDVVECETGESCDEHLRGIESHGKKIGEENNRFESMVFEAIRSRDY
jgi:SAM-dependent methyltransferase